MTPEELGYERDWRDDLYYKPMNNGRDLFIGIRRWYNDDGTIYYRGYIQKVTDILDQRDIDNIQIAYNNLQRDLKELNK